METTERINVRGAIKSLEVEGGSLVLPNAKTVGKEIGYIPSSIRSSTNIVSSDTGREFTVSVTDEIITVTRKT